MSVISTYLAGAADNVVLGEGESLQGVEAVQHTLHVCLEPLQHHHQLGTDIIGHPAPSPPSSPSPASTPTISPTPEAPTTPLPLSRVGGGGEGKRELGMAWVVVVEVVSCKGRFTLDFNVNLLDCVY